MMPLTNKLTIRVLVLPISLLSLAIGASFYIYYNNFDVSSFATTIASFTSSIVVIMLVWERLRESLIRKLEYLHDNFFLDIYTFFKLNDETYISSYFLRERTNIKEKCIDLQRYSSFIGINLFSKNLLSKIKTLLLDTDILSKKADILFEASKEILSEHTVDKLTVLRFFGMGMPLVSPSIGEIAGYHEIRKMVDKKQPKLIDDTKKLYKKITENKKQILLELEEYLKCNSLRLNEKT